MIEPPPKFPDNPDHANGTCEDCGEPCQVYGCRWCPGCYDAGSASLREASRAARWTGKTLPVIGKTFPLAELPVNNPHPSQRSRSNDVHG